MRSLFRTFPFIGALLISAVPVQAFETLDEYLVACADSAENTKLCDNSTKLYSAMIANKLCKLDKVDFLTVEEVTIYWEKVGLDP